MKKFFIVPLIMLIMASCGSVAKNHIAIKGLLIDSETDKPIKDATVKITLLKPKEVFETSSDQSGNFDFSDSDIAVLPEFLSDEADFEMKLRSVKLIFEHPDFVEDEYEEEIEFVPVNEHEVDVGAFYLRPRDKVDENGNIIIE